MHDGSLHGTGQARSCTRKQAAASWRSRGPGVRAARVAHEAGEHASFVVDYKLHVTTRANVSKQPADLRAGLSASTSRQMADCTAGQHKSQDTTCPASTQSWQRPWPGRRRRSHARQAAHAGCAVGVRQSSTKRLRSAAFAKRAARTCKELYIPRTR